MTYGISSRDYLARAKLCLARDNLDSLFYAAFELRCGIEARMQEYLEVQTHISTKKRQGWQVAILGRSIEDAFRLGEKEAVLRVRNRATGKVLLEARYTPVKKALQKKAQRLGDVLHAAKKFHAPESPYWKKFRAELEVAVSELEHANSGRLLGPPLLHPNKKQVDMKLELPTPEEQKAVKCLTIGGEAIMEVNYE